MDLEGLHVGDYSLRTALEFLGGNMPKLQLPPIGSLPSALVGQPIPICIPRLS